MSNTDDDFLDWTKESRLRRNPFAKKLRDYGEHKGAFALKIIDSRKQEYKRIKMKKENVDAYEEDG